MIVVVISGSKKFFLGIDFVFYYKDKKEVVCGCVGVYIVYVVIELYVEVFEEVGVLDKLEGFVSYFGFDFYGLECNKDMIILVRESWIVFVSYKLGDFEVVLIKVEVNMDW